jgi:hypothetical protein
MLSTNTIVKNMERMDRIINEYSAKLESLEQTEEVLELIEKIEKYNEYKKDFIHPKKGVYRKILDNSFRDTIRKFQDNISGDILFCFISKKED